MPTPEERARELIDAKLHASGWVVQSYRDMNLGAGIGLAITEFPGAHGPSDYLLYVEGKALGVVEAKPIGHTLRGVEGQSASYTDGLAASLPAWRRPLPFQYESTGEVTQFTNWIEPHARSRDIFSIHRPETLCELVQSAKPLRAWLWEMPPIPEAGLWPKQYIAIQKLEASLGRCKPKALIQMATGSGKTFTAANVAYRLIKHGRARRVCFLVDRTNLGTQTLKEFQQFQPPGEGRNFDKLYNIAFPQRNRFDPINRVIITTIQRLYSVLTNQAELAEEDEERSTFEGPGAFKKPPVPITYNPALPPEFFDVIIVDECHRSIYSVWGDVLKYFDAFLIGLTATPSKQTIGFFDKNLVMEYTHEEAVADRVNVPYDVYQIRTRITTKGSTVDAGFYVGKRSRKTRRERQEELDQDFQYGSEELDRAVVAEDQIRTVIQTFRDKLFTAIFPGRTEVPKTIVFAKDDSHADDIVRIVREEFGRGNEFCQKITYRTGTMRLTRKVTDPDGTEREEAYYEKIKGKTGEDVLTAFRNSFNPRIAVTVDMIATGTDVKPVEIVFFMRSIRSSNYFEQMKGRGVRVIPKDVLNVVTPAGNTPDGAPLPPVTKTRFVIVDAVGVCEQVKSERGPLDREPSKTLKQVLDYIKAGGTDPDAVTALAAKLNRMSAEMSDKQHAEVRAHAAGKSTDDLVAGLVASVNEANVEAMRPYLRVANVYEDRIDTTNVLQMNFTPDEYEVYGLQHGDILLNEGQSMELVGRPAMYRDELPGGCFQNTLVRQRVFEGLMPEFALMVCRAQFRAGRYRQIASITTSIAHLGAQRFAGLEFPLPPEREQAEIVETVQEKLSQIDALEAEVERGLKRASRMRQAILKAAFEGKLVPQDPNDEPASAMLERIQREAAATETKRPSKRRQNKKPSRKMMAV